VEIVDLDLLFQIPQKYTRIIGGKREEASSREATMEVENMLKNTQEHTQTVGEEAPFIANQIGPSGATLGQILVKSRSRRALCRPSRCTARCAPDLHQKSSERWFSVKNWCAPGRPVYSPVTPARNRPPGVQPGHAGPKPASR
jgi:hypothetical protein